MHPIIAMFIVATTFLIIIFAFAIKNQPKKKIVDNDSSITSITNLNYHRNNTK